MSIIDLQSRRWAARTQSLLRIVAALLFIFHGTQKLFGFPPGQGPREPLELLSMVGVAGILETFGGFLILLGLGTRAVALLLSGEMAVAYFKAHAPAALLPIENRGELAALYSFLWLYFAAAGAGPWSLDALIARRLAKPADVKAERSDARRVA